MKRKSLAAITTMLITALLGALATYSISKANERATFFVNNILAQQGEDLENFVASSPAILNQLPAIRSSDKLAFLFETCGTYLPVIVDLNRFPAAKDMSIPVQTTLPSELGTQVTIGINAAGSALSFQLDGLSPAECLKLQELTIEKADQMEINGSAGACNLLSKNSITVDKPVK